MTARILHTGEAKVLVALTVEQLIELAIATNDLPLRSLLLTAIGLLDAETERALREAMACGT